MKWWFWYIARKGKRTQGYGPEYLSESDVWRFEHATRSNYPGVKMYRFQWADKSWKYDRRGALALHKSASGARFGWEYRGG